MLARACVAERACWNSVYDVLLNTVIPCLHTVIGVGEFNEQPCVIGGVVVCVYVVVVQGETMRPRDTIIRVEDSEVNYLLTHHAVRVAVTGRYLAKTPAMFGPFEEYVLPNHLFSCWVKS